MPARERFLLDANIIIGARRGDRYSKRILSARGLFQFLVTEEIAEELGKVGVPPGVEVVPSRPPTKKVAFDAPAFKAYIEKEFGGPGGSRKELSRADKSLVRVYTLDPTIRGIVSSDKRDIEYAAYNYPELNREVLILTAEEFVKKFL